MTKKFKVVWAVPAHLDLVEIAEYIAEDNPQAARNIVKKIRGKISKLRMSPSLGRVVPELEKQGITHFREMILSPWRILYQVGDKAVYILMVVDGRRNLEDVLFNRLMR